MAVTSSVAKFDGPVQADGRRQVQEAHQLSDGNTISLSYFTTPETDIQAIAAARAPSILTMLADSEAYANVERDGAFTLNHQTGAQFATRFREMVRDATEQRACYLAWWLIRRIVQGHVTDAAVRNAFGMNAATWTTFKTTKVQPRHDAWAAVLAATGE